MRRRLIALVALLTYPVWSHIAVMAGHPEWSIAGLAVPVAISAMLLGQPGRYGRSGGVLLGLVVLAAFHDAAGHMPLALYLPPILVPLGCALLFGRTLLAGRTPLITLFVERVMGEDRPDKARYTRGVTIYWTVLFSALALESLVLALFADAHTWSVFTNGINYAVIAAGFVAEFAVRCMRFGCPERPLEFFARLLGTDFRRLG